MELSRLTVIDGVLSFPAGIVLRDIAGTVRLENVTLADAASLCVASASFSASDADRPIPFRLVVKDPIDQSQDYVMTAEADVIEVATGRRRRFGTRSAIVWAATMAAPRVAVHLEPWT
jgi:hypothetical protein